MTTTTVLTTTVATPQFHSVIEMDEARPRLNDGNYLLELIHCGLLNDARAEVYRLTTYYHQTGISVECVNEWRQWCKGVERYLSLTTSNGK